MRSLRVAAGSCALVLMLVGARAGQACEAMVGTEYSDPPEAVDPGLSSEWHTVFRARDAGTARKEWVPAGETLSRWSQLVTWWVQFGENPLPLVQLKDNFLKNIGYVCPKVESRVSKDTEGDLVFEWWHGECYGRDEQYHISRFTSAATGTHHLSYSVKGKPLTSAERERWVSKLSNTPIEVAGLPDGEPTALDRARMAVWRADYASAFELLQSLAASGSAGAQRELAGLYFEGWGTAQDRTKAAEWLRKAAAQDLPEAHYDLARLYENGWGVEQDPAQARKWFESAAKLGNAEAQGRLGYLMTNDTEPDYEAAARWLRSATEQGHDHALFWLGRLHEEGWGMKQDLTKAADLYTQLAILGESDAQYRIGLLYHEGRGVPADRAQASKWIERAAAQGNAEARDLFLKEYSKHRTGIPVPGM